MKIKLLTAASLMALAAGAAHAQTVPNGYVGAGYDYTSGNEKFTENGDGSTQGKINDHTSGYFFDGAVSLPVTSLIGVQGDLAYGNASTSFDETFNDGSSHEHFGNHSDGTTASAHVFARTDQWLAGAFVGEDDTGEVTLKGGGVEGQYYMGPFTFEGSLGAATESAGNFEFGNTFKPYVVSGRAAARYFITPDFQVGVHAGYMDGSSTFHESGDFSETLKGPGLWTVGVGGEYKVPGQPLTLSVNYEHGDGRTDESDSDGFHDHATVTGDDVKVGLRWTFGGSLLDRDRHGASLPTFKDMFGGAFGTGLEEFFQQD